jgi:hypothetical protein
MTNGKRIEKRFERIEASMNAVELAPTAAWGSLLCGYAFVRFS